MKTAHPHHTYAPSMSLNMAVKRAKMLAQVREFFAKREVLEVQTPILSQAGNTDVFVESVQAHVHLHGHGGYQEDSHNQQGHNQQDSRTQENSPKQENNQQYRQAQNKQVQNRQAQSYYLHTSPEFAMKRMLASWQRPIYQICPVFRDNEIGKRHNVEFTMLEWYRPAFTLNQLANELAELLAELFGSMQIFTHYRYIDAFMDHVGVHPLKTSCEVLAAVAEDKGLTGIHMGDDHQGWLDVLFSHLVEPKLGHDLPTLIIDYPPATASLAKVALDKEGNKVAKRFELYINGIEIANAYDELADGQALRVRFEQDNLERKARGLDIIPIDQHLLSACDDLPECSGIALGLDRLLMVMEKMNHIESVIGFGIERA